MFGHLDPSGGFFVWILVMIITWATPLILLVWLIRSVNAMVAAQRQIAEQLRIIADDVRSRPSTVAQR